MMSKAIKTLFIVFCVVLLASCGGNSNKSSGGRYKQAQDTAPKKKVNLAKVPCAKPKHENYSRYGNPPSYVVFGKTYHVWDTHLGYEEEGLASWYGTKFQGYSTSSGEPYDMYQMTAAHKHLPVPSYAKVTNLKNKKSVIVKVNDRGPFHSDRIIDLSYVAAAKLDILSTGTGHVRVESIDVKEYNKRDRKRGEPEAVPEAAPEPVPYTPIGDEIYLQIAALGSFDGAHDLANKVEPFSDKQVHVYEQGDLFRVQIGPFNNEFDANNFKESTLAQLNLNQAFLVRR